MEPKDILQPRVFLCKAGRFFEGLNGQMGSDYDVPKEKFGNDDFQKTCDPKDLETVGIVSVGDDEYDDENNDEYVDGEESEDGEEGEESSTDDPTYVDPDDIQIIEIRDDDGLSKPVHDLPILVFEGLPEPRHDQTEEDLVESILNKAVKLPRASVRTALRLPMLQTNGKALTVVEMDTMEHEKKVLQRKNKIQRTRVPDLNQLAIRRAKYKELWKLLEELSVAKRVIPAQSTGNKDDNAGEDTTEEPEDATDWPFVVSNNKDNDFIPGLNKGVIAKASINVASKGKSPK